MANDGPNNRDERRDEPKRRGGVTGGSAGSAVADEGDGMAFAGMAGAGVVAAILVSMLWLSGLGRPADDDKGAVAAATTVADDSEDEGGEDEGGEDEGGEDEAAAATTTTEAVTTTEAPTTTEAVTTTEAPAGAAATIDASQSGIVLSGTVPSEEAAQRLRDAAAAAGYQADQITDELVVEDGAEPFTLTVTGSTTDGVLHGRLTDEITDIENNLAGVSVDNGFTLEESSDLEAALNALDPVQFESGTAVITAETAGFVEEAAALLTANPDVRVEVSGHTDTRGSDVSNQALSEARAAAVVTRLIELGVAEEQLVAIGYGESRPVHPDDSTQELQQENRRIEYRLLAS